MIRLIVFLFVLVGAHVTVAAAQGITAILEPVQLVDLKPSVAGRIEAIHISEGEAAIRSDLLAEIDANVQKARLSLAETAAQATAPQERANILVAQAEALLQRIQKARNRGAAQAWEVRQAEQALALAQADARVTQEGHVQHKAQLALEQATLSEFQVQAPFDGTVLRILVEPGEVVATDTTVLEYGNLTRLRANAFLPFDWVKSLSVGDTLNARLGNADQKAVEVIVVSIDPRVDPASQSVRVRLEMENPDRKVFAGTAISLQRP